MPRELNSLLVLPTQGTCMRPWIWPHGEVHVQRCGPEALRLGDIAVWFDGRNLRSHRVIELRQGGTFVTRGDLCPEADASAASHQLIGRAVAFSRGGVHYGLDGALSRSLGRALSLAAGHIVRLPFTRRTRF